MTAMEKFELVEAARKKRQQKKLRQRRKVQTHFILCQFLAFFYAWTGLFRLLKQCFSSSSFERLGCALFLSLSTQAVKADQPLMRDTLNAP